MNRPMQRMKTKKLAILAIILAIGAVGFYSYGALIKTRSTPVTRTEPRFNKNPKANATHFTPGSTTNKEPAKIWHPDPRTSWQWQLSTPIDQSIEAQMYDIDLFSNDASVVSSLHAKGRKVICYISAGSVEDWRPDANQFPKIVVGKDYRGWPGEKWLDIRRIDLLAPIMEKRLDDCRSKGFDGVEPDNINGYTQDAGFALTADDQLKYNIWLAGAAHNRGLSIGLKQDPDQAASLVSYYDWALDEECFEFGGCDKMLPFIQSGKAVFNTEYNLETSKFCNKANDLNFNSIKKHKELDAYLQACR